MKFTNENIPRNVINACDWRPNDIEWCRKDNVVYSKLRCLNEVFSLIKDDVVLVTEEGDYTLYEHDVDFYAIRHTNGSPFGYIKGVPDNVVRWYGTNLNVSHEKMTLLPFGTLKKHEEFLIQEPLKDPQDKSLLYVNFSPSTSYRRRDLYYRIRNCDFATVEWPPGDVPTKVYERYLQNYIYMTSMHKFIVCPEGCGIDSFRIWEALSLGCIPILERSHFSRHLALLRLPILIINDYNELKPEVLHEKYEILMDQEWDLEVLTKEYWIKKFNDSL